MTTDRTFRVSTEFITLGQLLKAMGVVSTGGEAKMMLSEGGVSVNAEPESQRGRKLKPGDVVQLPNGAKIHLTA